MGNLDRRHQMANMNDLESMLLKVCSSFLVEVVSKEGTMDQRDSFCLQCPEAGSCRRADMRTGMPFEYCSTRLTSSCSPVVGAPSDQPAT